MGIHRRTDPHPQASPPSFPPWLMRPCVLMGWAGHGGERMGREATCFKQREASRDIGVKNSTWIPKKTKTWASKQKEELALTLFAVRVEARCATTFQINTIHTSIPDKLFPILSLDESMNKILPPKLYLRVMKVTVCQADRVDSEHIGSDTWQYILKRKPGKERGYFSNCRTSYTRRQPGSRVRGS